MDGGEAENPENLFASPSTCERGLRSILPSARFRPQTHTFRLPKRVQTVFRHARSQTRSLGVSFKRGSLPLYDIRVGLAVGPMKEVPNLDECLVGHLTRLPR